MAQLPTGRPMGSGGTVTRAAQRSSQWDDTSSILQQPSVVSPCTHEQDGFLCGRTSTYSLVSSAYSGCGSGPPQCSDAGLHACAQGRGVVLAVRNCFGYCITAAGNRCICCASSPTCAGGHAHLALVHATEPCTSSQAQCCAGAAAAGSFVCEKRMQVLQHRPCYGCAVQELHTADVCKLLQQVSCDVWALLLHACASHSRHLEPGAVCDGLVMYDICVTLVCKGTSFGSAIFAA
jgi:hypothetical protein